MQWGRICGMPLASVSVLLLSACGVMHGGYITQPNDTRIVHQSLIDYEPEEAPQFAQDTQKVLATLRQEAASGRIYSATGLIPLAGLIAYKSFTQSGSANIAALIFGGGALYGAREYALAPRFEKIYSRAEAAIQCTRAEYAVAKLSVDVREIDPGLAAQVATSIAQAKESVAKVETTSTRIALSGVLSMYQQKKLVADAYLDGPLRQQKALLFKAVLLIIAQANRQIVDDQPTIAEDRSLFGGAFSSAGLPVKPPATDFTQPQFLANFAEAPLKKDGTEMGTQNAAPVDTEKVKNEKGKIDRAITDLKLVEKNIQDYVSAANAYPPAANMTFQSNYAGCAYEQVSGSRVALGQPFGPPLSLGANDADQGKTFELTAAGTVLVPISGGTPQYLVSIARISGTGSDLPSARITSLATGAVVEIGNASVRENGEFQVYVRDSAGALKQFKIKVSDVAVANVRGRRKQ